MAKGAIEMKRITLTRNQFTIVDDEDSERLNTHKWNALWKPDIQSFYAVRSVYGGNERQRIIRMHREIMSAPNDLEVDHINHDTLDNRRENLRVCTNGQNQANRRLGRDNTSGYKGVSWHRDCGKWVAQINFNGKRKHIGLFTTAIEAALAYDRAAIERGQDFALTNRKLGLIP